MIPFVYFIKVSWRVSPREAGAPEAELEGLRIWSTFLRCYLWRIYLCFIISLMIDWRSSLLPRFYSTKFIDGCFNWKSYSLVRSTDEDVLPWTVYGLDWGLSRRSFFITCIPFIEIIVLRSSDPILVVLPPPKPTARSSIFWFLSLFEWRIPWFREEAILISPCEGFTFKRNPATFFFLPPLSFNPLFDFET